MHIDILHSGLVPKIDGSFDEREFDAGRYSFQVINETRWGSDRNLLRGGHHENSPDVIVAHSSMFQFDILRMLRFILSARARAPWVVFILLISDNEESELSHFPTAIRDHFSRYFQLTSKQFSLVGIDAYIKSNYQRLEDLVLEKRRQLFGTEIILRSAMRADRFSRADPTYDFALSFAGAQRAHARDLANALKGRGCDVFFDEFETTSIVGKNLAEELYRVYSGESRYCVILVSEAYKAGPWTNQERRAALDRAISQSDSSYILPIRVEDIELPGLSSSISYLKWGANVSDLANVLYEKLVTDMVQVKVELKPRE